MSNVPDRNIINLLYLMSRITSWNIIRDNGWDIQLKKILVAYLIVWLDGYRLNQVINIMIIYK